METNIGKQYIKDYAKNTEQMFRDFLINKTEEALKISKVPGELIKRFTEIAVKGKRIRGALMTLGYELAGGTDIEAIHDASISIELFHAGVLVHDDIMDKDDTRRGVESIHSQFANIGKVMNLNTTPLHYGESMAINTGDVAFYFSWEKLLSCNFSAEHILEASKLYTEYVIRVVYGQTLDITNVAMHNLVESDILKIYQYKTAEYTGVLPLLMGVALAGCKDEKLLNAIREYGIAFGWAFQIQDDILGIYANGEKLGKPVGSDIREGKNTLLMLYVLQHGTKEQIKTMLAILGNKNISNTEIATMQKLIKDSGSYDHVVQLGWNYVNQGKKHIPNITQNKKHQELLEALIEYMMERVK